MATIEKNIVHFFLVQMGKEKEKPKKIKKKKNSLE